MKIFKELTIRVISNALYVLDNELHPQDASGIASKTLYENKEGKKLLKYIKKSFWYLYIMGIASGIMIGILLMIFLI